MKTVEFCVAKGRGGRPRKADGERGTKHVRLFGDLAEMIAWIYHFESLELKKQDKTTSVAQILDPMLRPQVVARYSRYFTAVEAIKKAEQGATKPPKV